MRNWSTALLRLFVASLLLVPCIGALSPANAFAQNAFAVTFAQNDSPNDQVVAPQTSQVAELLTLFANLVPSFTNSPNTFLAWNTSADGTGTTYSNGQMYSFASDITLYAQWSSPFHTVTFAENSSLNDSVVAGQTENSASSLTRISSLSPSFQNANYSFSGWNTIPGGGGTSYSDGASYAFSADIILYAQWTAVPTTTTTTPTTTTPTTTTTTTTPTPTVTTTTSPVTIVSPPRPSSGPTNLVINFESDGATGTVNPVSLSPGTSMALPLAATLSDPGFTFAGWFTSAAGGQLLGQGGATLTPSLSETAFAQWVADVPATLSFSANQGNGTVGQILGAIGAVVTVSGSKGMVRSGYVFSGWNTSANASGSNYAIGSQFTLNGATTLYAQWSKAAVSVPETVLIGSVGPFLNHSVTLTGALRAQIRAVAGKMHLRKFISVALYGYDAGSGSFKRHMTLSTQRALSVVEYLRAELARFGAVHMRMTMRGEGEITGFTAAMFRRVEIFAN
ncbi:MAG: InlB B-repeat-containing protein [Acidimicrobiales bacterium]